MKQNVGSMDRIARIALGAALLVVGLGGYAGVVPLPWTGIGQALTAVVAVLLGLILLGTGLARTCLIYSALGISTVGNSAEEASEADAGMEKAA